MASLLSIGIFLNNWRISQNISYGRGSKKECISYFVVKFMVYPAEKVEYVDTVMTVTLIKERKEPAC